VALSGLVKAVVPGRVTAAARTRRAHFASRAARRAFADADVTPIWLGPEALDALQSAFPPVPDYPYDAVALDRRGAARADELRRIGPPRGRTLEIGAADAMVSCHLAEAGFSATALDLSSDLVDHRAGAAGVRFIEGDAAAIPIEDDAFDLAFSYNSFEHFPDPECVLDELIRVTRPGGIIHLDFGPLYFSPYGLHAYRSIDVPYCHLLFEPHVLERYVEEHGLSPIPFDDVNGWSVGQFRELWASRDRLIDRVRYTELPAVGLAGQDLVVRFPSCFRAKTSKFDDLFVATIRATFHVRRTARPRSG
jgi:SAM-dependent methyltransferase